MILALGMSSELTDCHLHCDVMSSLLSQCTMHTDTDMIYLVVLGCHLALANWMQQAGAACY